MPVVTTLRSIEIDELAGRHGTLTAEFDESLTVFYGLNGSGKTTLLRVLASALNDNALSVADANFTEARVSFYSVNHDTIYTRILKNRPHGGEAGDWSQN
jgi:ABC-type Na+ transport system ATPase subunit NatA